MSERVRRWGFRGLVSGLLLLAGYYALFGGVYSVFDMRRMQADRENLVDRLDSLIVRLVRVDGGWMHRKDCVIGTMKAE